MESFPDLQMFSDCDDCVSEIQEEDSDNAYGYDKMDPHPPEIPCNLHQGYFSGANAKISSNQTSYSAQSIFSPYFYLEQTMKSENRFFHIQMPNDSVHNSQQSQNYVIQEQNTQEFQNAPENSSQGHDASRTQPDKPVMPIHLRPKRCYRQGLDYYRSLNTPGHQNFFRWEEFPEVFATLKEFDLADSTKMDQLKVLYNKFIKLFPQYDINSRNVRRNKSCLVSVFNEHLSEFREFLKIYTGRTE